MDDNLDQFMESHLNHSYGDILNELNDLAEHTEEYPDLDEPWDEMLAEQELWDFEQADEFFGCCGGDEDW